ncbi:MAG: single-stranded-DNA-specific exonuclease RecJ, partial [Bacillota bacterium]|nr:single-stranded-DNA-specific exonuclease RecJ [Bacillota bacterium]
IPSRFDEGYGLNQDAIDQIKKDGGELIVTVDCGSVSYDEVEYGKGMGIDFIVTDHHNINDKPADCILINPKQVDCPYPFKQLAGCGVAFKLAQGLQRKAKLPKSVLTEVLDLVAIATIGDIVPLVDENRTLTKYGLDVIRAGKRPGLRKLIHEVGLTSDKIKSENIAYIIVPHLNAAGRMMDAGIGVELLTSKNEAAISAHTAEMIKNNKERKRIQEEAFQKCKELITEKLTNDLFYVIDPDGIHEGIAGIVAGKIKEEYGRPTIIVTESGGDGFLKGTGRSISTLNLYDLLKKNERLFLKFGGHSGACGFLMQSDHLQTLREALNHEVQMILQENENLFDEELFVDVDIDGRQIDMSLAQELEKLAPFGCQNERPLFRVKGIQPSKVSFMGSEKQHVRFSGAGTSGRGLPCILFQSAQSYCDQLLSGTFLDLVGYPDINEWNGESKIQFVLKGITY